MSFADDPLLHARAEARARLLAVHSRAPHREQVRAVSGLEPRAALAPGAPHAHRHRSRGTYILLGVLLGGVGAHNWYAGHYLFAGLQFAATVVFGAVFPPALLLVAAWVLLELCAIRHDGRGHRLR